MTNTLLIGTITLLIAAIVIVARKIMTLALIYVQVIRKRERIQIAILTPSIKPPFSLFSSGFISHLKRYASFDFDIIECDGQGDTKKIDSWASYLIDSRPNLIYPICQVALMSTYSHMLKSKYKAPIVCGGIALETAEIPLTEMQEKAPFTGIGSTFGWHGNVSAIKKAFPQFKNILVLFRSSENISHTEMKEKNLIASSMRKNHINMHVHHITDIRKNTEITRELLQGIDLIVISRGSSILMKSAGRIASDAARFNVPVFSPEGSHVHSVFISTASSIEKKIGISCAKQAMKILEDGIEPRNIPITQIDPVHIMQLNLAHSGFIGMKKNVTRLLSQAKQVTISLR